MSSLFSSSASAAATAAPRLLSFKPSATLLLPKTPPSSLLFSSPISFHRLRAHHQSPPAAAAAEAAAAEPAADLTLLPPALRDIVALFQSVSDPKAKYHQLLHYSRQLPPLDPRYKTDSHRVRGCVSQVWVRAFPDPADPAAVCFQADSDSALTKGLAALLVLGLSGSPAASVARVPPDFVHLLGLRQSLTPSRNNGFLNMLRLMQQMALQLHDSDSDINLAAQDSILPEKDLSLGGTDIPNENVEGVDGVLEIMGDDAEEAVAVPSSSDGGGRAERIREVLERKLSPVELVVDDISHQHAGHAGVRASSGGETHFNLRVVSEEFEGKSLVKRHRIVYGLLQDELLGGLHALSIDAKTPSEVLPS